MTHSKESPDNGSGVYLSKDIQRLFNLGANEINSAIQNGTIPKPLPTSSKGKKRWAKAIVNKQLGINSTLPANAVISVKDLEGFIVDTAQRILRNGYTNI